MNSRSILRPGLIVVGLFLLLSGKVPHLLHLAPAAASPQAVPDFPRLGMWFPDVWNESLLAQIARFDFLVLDRSAASRLARLKTANPNQRCLVYQALGEVAYDPQGDPAANAEVRSLPHQWFLTQAGSKLTAPVDAAQTVLPVAGVVNADGTAAFVPGDSLLIDGETALVLAVNAAGNLLTVQRGTIRPASAHNSGTRVAALISFWPATWVMNASTLAPRLVVDASVGPENWAEYRARQGVQLVNGASWDGLLVDRGSATQSWLIGNSTARSIDPGNANALPADGYAAFDQAWGEGVRAYHQRLRAGLGSRLICVNAGMPNYDLVNGNNFEGFPLNSGGSYGGDWQATVFGWLKDGSYADWLARSQRPNLTMIETYEDDRGPGATANTSASIPCAQPGFVPNYRKMRFGLATALLGDGYFSYEMSTALHGSQCLMWFDEYDNAGAGRGYLGSAAGSARRAISLTTPGQVVNGGFDSGWNGWSFWADSANGYAASRTLDTAAFHQGPASARVEVTQSRGEDWRVALEFAPIGVAAGTEYTVSFWAQASGALPVQVRVQQGSPPWTGYSSLSPVPLTTTWQRYEVSFVASGSDAAAHLILSMGAAAGTYWLDEVQLQAGSASVWRRDYAGGIVLVNATAGAVTLPLAGEFRKISGRQAPAINDGSLVSQVTLAGHDGLILLRQVPLNRVFLPLVGR